MSSFWTPNGEHQIGQGPSSPDLEVLNNLSKAALSRGQEGPSEDKEIIAEMRHNRRVNSKLNKTADLVGGYSQGGGMSFATGRPQDPMFYWKQSNLPYDIWKPDELILIRHYVRLIYLTHPLIASAIDIYSKYPLQGLEIACKDDELKEFYSTLFFDDLNYEEYLTSILHEYWLSGEAFPLGQWNASLGIWEDDELMNPDDIDVIKTRFSKEPRFEMRLPEDLRKILRDREPRWEYEQLVNAYPELMHFMGDDARMPVSNIVLKHIAFKADTFHPRGIPILMRGFRAIFQEEMLNAAQDAIASRLYTPLILAKLGASASDLGTSVPWIPTAQDLGAFEEALDEALSGDFRVLTHHFALDMESVFGREVMPDLTADFDRLAERQLQVFGMSRTMLSGSADGETYAADALNLDIMSQLMGQSQKLIKRFFHARAKVVAEAQEHFDYREENGKKYLIYEEVLEKDPNTGVASIIERPKLLVPDLKIKAMDLKGEQARQEILDMAAQNGIVISNRSRLINVDIDLEEELEIASEEQVKRAVMTEQTRKKTYLALSQAGLPIQPDLEQDFRPKAMGAEEPQPAAEPMPLPNMQMNPVGTSAILDPLPEDYMAQDQEDDQEGVDPMASAPPAQQPQGVVVPLVPPTRPEESDERRADMPKPASLNKRFSRRANVTDTVVIQNGQEVVVHEGLHRLISGPLTYSYEVSPENN